MSKTLKNVLIFLLFLIILFNCNFVKAVDLNLTENTSFNENTSSTNSNYNSNENYTSSTSNNSNTSYDNSSVVNPPSATVSSVQSSGLDLSNILNIFLIVIGVLIILLAIAILIKLKN